MSWVTGGLNATSSRAAISRHTIPIYPNPFLKTITMTVMLYTPCKDYSFSNEFCGETKENSRFNLQAAALFPDVKDLREMAIEQMKTMVEKFPGGFDDYKE